jgi:hypothetical protein
MRRLQKLFTFRIRYLITESHADTVKDQKRPIDVIRAAIDWQHYFDDAVGRTKGAVSPGAATVAPSAPR